MTGIRSLPPVNAAISRAIPRTLRQSPRLGVTLTSSIQSSRPRYPYSDAPAGASTGNSMMPR